MRGGGPNEMHRIIRSLLAADFNISAVKDNSHSLGVFQNPRQNSLLKRRLKLMYGGGTLRGDRSATCHSRQSVPRPHTRTRHVSATLCFLAEVCDQSSQNMRYVHSALAILQCLRNLYCTDHLGTHGGSFPFKTGTTRSTTFARALSIMKM